MIDLYNKRLLYFKDFLNDSSFNLVLKCCYIVLIEEYRGGGFGEYLFNSYFVSITNFFFLHV